MKEIWKDIPGYQNKYQASNEGRVRSLLYKNRFGTYKRKKQFIMKPHIHPRGYLKIDLEQRTFFVHRLVGMAFLGKSSLVINHKNGKQTDNRIENLEWVTQKQNAQHALKNGWYRRGERHGNSKLTEKQAFKIKYKESGKYDDIGKKYNVVKSTICAIKNGKLWGHI